MRNQGLSRASLSLLVLAGWLASAAQNPVYDLPLRATSATVQILAAGSKVRLGFGGNEDIYLARITVRGKESEIVKLLDDYRHTESPILHSVLVERHSLKMKLTRDPQCDQTGASFYLKEDRDIFDPESRVLLSENAKVDLPCFKVDHRETRLAK